MRGGIGAVAAMEISLLLNDVPDATPEATTESPESPEIRKSTAIGTQTEPVPRDVPRDVAFLLKVDGSIQKVDVPLDENGVAVITWKVLNAFPTQLDAPGFSASANDVAIESMQLTADAVLIEES